MHVMVLVEVVRAIREVALNYQAHVLGLKEECGIIFPPLLGTSGKDKHSLAYHNNTSCCVKKRVLGTSLLIQALSS